MNEGIFEYQQYEYVFKFGYPFFLVAVTEFRKPQNYIIEYYTMHANYNDNNNDLIFQYDSANKYLKQGYKQDEVISLGLNQLKQNTENAIANSEDKRNIKSIPLKKRDLNLDALDLLQTLPDFDKIQDQFLEKTSCISLKSKMDTMKKINVDLRIN